jgi:DNA polymerase-3 subunit alpha
MFTRGGPGHLHHPSRARTTTVLRLITSYASNAPYVQVGELRAQLPALVEHEDDGTRWLLVLAGNPAAAPRSAWEHALRNGAAGVMGALEDGVYAFPVHKVQEYDLGDGQISLGAFREAIFDAEDGIPTYHEVLDQLEAKQDPPQAASGFVHLHTHSEYSPLDGLSRMDEIVREVTAHGQTAVAITDHGTCAGHPELQRAADKAGVKPIFGCEIYLCDDRVIRAEPGDKELQAKLRNDYWHVCLFAQDNTGLRNIWAASTESFRDGFYHRPRMDWDTLGRFSEGVIASTGCLRGPVAVALKDGDMELARQRLTRLMDIYPGRLYVELQPNDMPDQVNLNQALVALAREFGLPLLATVDSHFPTADDAHAHDVWIACQTNKDVQDEGDLFAEDLNLYVMGEDEVRAGLAYLGEDVVEEAIANTRALAERCNARIEGETAMPSFTGDPALDVQRLRKLCETNWDRLPIGDDASYLTYRERYEREMELLVTKGFCGYYLMVADYVGWAKDHGILVGPGRGSGGGSLVAYLARITSLDPVKHDLLFERFLTMGRAGLPDFDVDFPASKKAEILGYLRERWGERNVVSIGSELRLKNRAVINELVRALASSLPENAAADLRQVSALIDEAEAGTAGLGMSWEDLWVQHGEQLQPFADRYPELFAMAERLVGRLKSYGRHAAGVVISTGAPLTDWLPMRTIDGEEQMVTQWAMGDVEAIGLVKFDILTLRTLDTIQQTLDLVREQRRYEIDLEAWEAEFEDPLVWDELQAAHTLGVFQIETHSGTRLCERMRPQNVAELADMVTIVRPGPMNSGLTDLYLRRRAGEQAVSYPDPRLEMVLAPTYGAMIYQEQVMAVTRLLAGYDESEADGVRRILGKKKVSAIAEAGQTFLDRVDMPREQAERLWAQMAEFSKYGFNKSHAYAYAFLAFWTAFLKVNYPREFLVAAMSTVDKDRVPEFVKEARRLDVEVLPPDINTSGPGFTADPKAVRRPLRPRLRQGRRRRRRPRARRDPAVRLLGGLRDPQEPQGQRWSRRPPRPRRRLRHPRRQPARPRGQAAGRQDRRQRPLRAQGREPRPGQPRSEAPALQLRLVQRARPREQAHRKEAQAQAHPQALHQGVPSVHGSAAAADRDGRALQPGGHPHHRARDARHLPLQHPVRRPRPERPRRLPGAGRAGGHRAQRHVLRRCDRRRGPAPQDGRDGLFDPRDRTVHSPRRRVPRRLGRRAAPLRQGRPLPGRTPQERPGPVPRHLPATVRGTAMSIIQSVSHPYWSALGAAARETRTDLRASQSKIAQLVGLTVREYAALESGFIPQDVADALGHLDLADLDEALGWDAGVARSFVDKALKAFTVPSTPHGALSFEGETPAFGDRSTYPHAAWVRLGRAVRAARMAEKLSRNELAYAMKSSSKTIMRLEEGRIYGDPRTAPPGDYNSERYILRRLAFLEMALEWEMGQAAEILQGQNRASVSPTA